MDFRDWMEHALCRRKKNDFWYPPLEAKIPDQYYAIGREICHRCPVWKDCLDAGLDEKWGMWGGLTPQERLPLVDLTTKKQNYKPHGSWIRYRQGCMCSDCAEAHEKKQNTINMSVLPKWQDPIDDLEMLHFRLLSTKE